MSDSSILCPLCGEGRLVEHTQERHFKSDDLAYVVTGLRYSLCSHCGEEITAPDQSRHNKRAIIAARDRAVAERDRVERLRPHDILRIRKQLGLTQVQAARVFGGGPNAFGKYENAEVAPSEGMEKLLRLADSVPEAASWLLRRAGLLTPMLPQAACRRRNDCVEFQRLIKGAAFVMLPENRGLPAPGLLIHRLVHPARQAFTYDANSAANDDRLGVEPGLAAMG